MTSLLKTTILFVITISFLAVSFTSCTKDNTKSTTVIKCVSCANGGSCIKDTCRCPAGYEGLTCQTLSIDKFLGEWSVFEKGSSTTQEQYGIEIETNAALGVAKVTIQGLYSPYMSFSESLITANINADSIFIPRQQLYNGYIIGQGIYHLSTFTGQPSSMTIRYQVTDTIAGVTDDFGYSSAVDSPSVWTQE